MPAEQGEDSSAYNPFDIEVGSDIDPLAGVIPLRLDPTRSQKPGKTGPKHAAPDPDDETAETTTAAAEQASANQSDDREGTDLPAGGDQAGKYRRRRATYQLVAAAAAAALLWHLAPWDLFTGQSSTTGDPHSQRQAALLPGTPASAVRPEEADMSRLSAALTAGEDLSQVKVTGALAAAAGSTAYIARTIDGVCTVYGVKDGQHIVPATDTTGQACTAEQIAAVQDALDQTEKARRQAQTDDLDDTLDRVAKTAAIYAARNIHAGVPSYRGLPAAAAQPARIAKNEGSWLLLRADDGATCRQVIVDDAGVAGEKTACVAPGS